MQSLIFTINSKKFDGSVHRSWKARLLSRDDPLLIFYGVFESEVSHPELGLIERGTASFEYYWLDRCYNVFRFENPKGGLRNYYCNVTLPPVISGESLDYIDLDIDVLVKSEGTYRILDEDEFVLNAGNMNYGCEVVETANAALQELLLLIRGGEFPFDIDSPKD